jgi:sigma-B regulation protein RsbU (phosphoserine phosphatase)
MTLNTILRPNPSSGVPLYLQLADQLSRAIESGAFRPGEPMPGVRPLAQELVVHPNAIARAYKALEARGLVRPFPADTRGPDVTRGIAPGSDLGPALEKGWLASPRTTRPPAADCRSREEILRELATAREVQERLLPQEYPAERGLDCAGLCRPALGVGGDYFDFVRAAHQSLGVAIGDVSGKGMPAALLMATLRASLRGQTMGRAADLAGVMANLNVAVFESSASNRYASLFYAQFDAAFRTLAFVNAGHNPPFVVKARSGNVVRLDPSGPVIGLMRECTFVERRMAVESGDVLVAFTDGITDAMNAAGDEWGEERLAHAVARHMRLPARELAAQIMRDVDGFVGSARQHDDMTLVAIRIP